MSDETDNNTKTINKTITENEGEALYELDQIYANKFYLGWGPDGIARLTFADEILEGKQPNFIISILMTPNGLLSLQNMIAEFISEKQKNQTVVTQTKVEREQLN